MSVTFVLNETIKEYPGKDSKKMKEDFVLPRYVQMLELLQRLGHKV